MKQKVNQDHHHILVVVLINTQLKYSKESYRKTLENIQALEYYEQLWDIREVVPIYSPVGEALLYL